MSFICHEPLEGFKIKNNHLGVVAQVDYNK